MARQGGRQHAADGTGWKCERLWECARADLEGLLTGGLEERVAAMIALCKRLPSIDEACIYSAAATSSPPCRFQAVLPGADPAGAASASRITATASLLSQVMASGKSCYRSPDHDVGQHRHDPADQTPPQQAVYLVPLGPRRRPVGVLWAGGGGAGGIAPESRRVLDLLATPFTLAIENARRHEQLTILARQAADRAEAAVPSTVSTIARLAHDIKNAMTTIMTFVQLLPSKWNDDHFRTSFYPVAREETMRASRLVGTILDQGRQQHAGTAPVDLEAVLKDLCAAKIPLAEQRRLRLRVHTDLSSPSIRIDRGAVEEAIVNLLANAMEASPDGGCIDIRLEDDVLSSGRPAIRLEIRDSGPGIEAHLQELIFTPYVSTKNGRGLAGGTGLGLSIARHHIEAHGGTIEVESPESGGALFRVTLPVERRGR